MSKVFNFNIRTSNKKTLTFRTGKIVLLEIDYMISDNN